MKSNSLFLVGFAAMSSLLAGCAVQPVAYVPGPPPPPVVYGGTTVVYDRYGAPPAPIVEVQLPVPTFRAVWVPGYWHWDGHRYGWRRGHYRHA
jgi:hypothetical protein